MIFKSPIFRKLLVSSILVIAGTLLFLDIDLTCYASRKERENTEQRLAAQATALLGEIVRLSPEELPGWARQTAQRAGVRVTVVDPGGVVLSDSERDPRTMENHSDRPEIRQALQNGRGAAVRHSATLGRDLCYVALSLSLDGRAGHILRLAVPLEDLDHSIAAVRTHILRASFVAALIALLLALLFSRSFSQRIRRLEHFAEGLADLKFTGALPPEAADELGSLARALNNLAARLRDMLDGLKLESAQWEAVLTSMVDGVLAVDQNLRVLFCNQAFARLVGAPAPASGSQSVMEMVRDPGLRKILQDVLSTGSPVRQRIQLSSMEGRTFEVQAGPLALASQNGAVAILHDISDFERVERVRRDFVANVSHELRTPLTSIRGFAETLLDGALEDPENNRHFVEVIQVHAIRLSRIASDLLTLSELDAGTSRGEAEKVPVRDVIESALRTVETEARLRNVRLIKGALGEVTAKGDRLRLEQVFVNLLDNAVKFNKPDGRVEIDAALNGEGKVIINVADTGIGIPSSDIARIFERFYRVDKGRSREVGGTGLGLSIVKHIVERLGGVVSVASHLGKGSTFTVTLPSA